MNERLVVAERLATSAEIAEWRAAIGAISQALGWSRGGEAPFSAVIGAGDRVLVKPNWVMHANKGPWGLAPLVTAPELVMAAAELALEAGAREVMLGDAPLQACDTAQLWAESGLSAWADALRARGARLRGPLDFRRTISTMDGGVPRQSTGQRDLASFRLVNLGADSLLEPITDSANRFRVTQYDPRLMPPRHHRGHHEYLVASEVLESTVVINLPKLKTHKKAGITAALKNLVGINGNKEFLPHHRVGSPREGGDCYPRPNPFKRLQETLYDAQNKASSHLARRAIRIPIGGLWLLSRYHGERFGLEGAWSGNDTVWRMALDLNRVLLHADREGTMRDAPQRRELHLVDAVVAGQGDGPLASEPFPLGLLLGADSAAAADRIGAELLGYEPDRIAIVREAFGRFRHPLSRVAASEVRLEDTRGGRFDTSALPRPERYPEGWLDCVAPQGRSAPPVGTTFSIRRRPDVPTALATASE